MDNFDKIDFNGLRFGDSVTELGRGDSFRGVIVAIFILGPNWKKSDPKKFAVPRVIVENDEGILYTFDPNELIKCT